MKPTNNSTTTAAVRSPNRRSNLPPAARRVEVDFYPQVDWTIEVGNAWPSVSNRRDQPLLRPADRPICGFAPIELVIAGENKKRTRWHVHRRAPMWYAKFK